MQKPWSLYNKEDKLRIDDLTSEHVRVILLSTAMSRMGHWYACQEGDVHWQPISSIPEFYEDVRQIKGRFDAEKTHVTPGPTPPPAAPPDLPRRPLFEDFDEDESKTDPALQVESAGIRERRSARRYARKLTFMVKMGEQEFRSDTTDISMTGIGLKQSLPAWIPKTFRAELGSGKTTIKVLCAKVSENQLKINEAASWDVIRAWIVSW